MKSNPSRLAFVYADDGADPPDVRQVIRTFQEILQSDVCPISAEEIRAGILTQSHAALLIMPGGRDLPYLRKLRGTGNANIRAAVEAGMRYFGICAGAYYACASIEFEPGTPLEVVGTRELQFFPGIGKGPLSGVGTYHYDSMIGARALAIRATVGGLSHELFAYLNGGCFFQDARSYPEIQILAEVLAPARPAVIIGRSIGKGRALMTGVHLEYPLEHFNPADPNLASILARLQQSDPARRDLLTALTTWLME